MEETKTPPAQQVADQKVTPTAAAKPAEKPEKKTPPLVLATLFLAALAGFFGVMWLNASRAMTAMEVSKQPSSSESQVPEAKTYQMPATKPVAEIIDLPAPQLTAGAPVNQVIQSRRSRREYSSEPVSLEQLSQILWSAQGVTDEAGHRAAPSAKGAYPYTLYVVVRNVEDLDDGLYQYLPEEHQLGSLSLANAGQLLTEAGVQENSQTAPVVIAMAATKAKMVEKFPDSNPDKNTYLEGGHIAQNIYLTVESLGMSTVVTGGFNPVAVGEALQLDPAEEVVYLVPMGTRVSE